MLTGLSVALAILAQASTAPQQSPTVTAPPAAKVTDSCPNASDGRTIVICAERPEGYRINPDVMEAKREKKDPGRPVHPGGKVIPDCEHVGPAPCMTAGINLIGAALTAAEMAKRLSAGQEIGSMFETDPHPSEYKLYQMAKARREAKEAEEAAMKAKAAAEAKEASQPAGN